MPGRSCQEYVDHQTVAIDTAKLKECSLDVPPEATTCSEFGSEEHPSDTSDGHPDYLDQCGCDGKTCAEGRTCVYSRVDFGGSCGGGSLPRRNVCLKVCASNSDCAADEICIPPMQRYYSAPTCAKATCKSDADCTTEKQCGSCKLNLTNYFQCFTQVPQSTSCEYLD